MKRFHFPLRPVAILRAHREQHAREIFAAAVRSHDHAETVLAGVRARVTAFETTLANGRRDRFSPAIEAQTFAAYRIECVAETESERRVAAARADLERERAAYLEAHRKVEVVRRLEEKSRTAYRAETTRVEQAEFDDFAGRRHFAFHTLASTPS